MRRRRDAGPEHEAALARIQARIQRPSGPRMVVPRGTQWSEHLPPLPAVVTPLPIAPDPAKVRRARWYGVALLALLIAVVYARAPHLVYGIMTGLLLVPFAAAGVLALIALATWPDTPPAVRWAWRWIGDRL